MALQRDANRMHAELGERYVNEAMAKFSRWNDYTRNALREARKRARTESEDKFQEAEAALHREYIRKQIQLAKTAENITRISPTSAASLTTSSLAGTDAALMNRFLEALQRYRVKFLDYSDAMIEEYRDKSYDFGDIGRSIMINTDKETGKLKWELEIVGPYHVLDVSDAPKFQMTREPIDVKLAAIFPDLAVLSIEFLVLFALSFIGFNRYDVR